MLSTRGVGLTGNSFEKGNKSRPGKKIKTALKLGNKCQKIQGAKTAAGDGCEVDPSETWGGNEIVGST